MNKVEDRPLLHLRGAVVLAARGHHLSYAYTVGASYGLILPLWHKNRLGPNTRMVVHIVLFISTGNASTPDLPTNIAGFRGFDSSVILILRVGILRYEGIFPESLSQAMLVGVMLAGRLGVVRPSSSWSSTSMLLYYYPEECFIR